MGEMLREGRISLNEAEHAALDKLQAENEGIPLTATRRDPGETGPLLVHVEGDTYLVNEDGTRKKQAN